MVKYRKVTSSVLKSGTHDVIKWQNGVAFKCPCESERTVVISEKVHRISFDPDGVLTLNPSVAYHASETRPQNWCHFWLKEGDVKMCGDAQCPGVKMAV